jgi:hypothetical protein
MHHGCLQEEAGILSKNSKSSFLFTMGEGVGKLAINDLS